jgi:hypothetical protein
MYRTHSNRPINFVRNFLICWQPVHHNCHHHKVRRQGLGQMTCSINHQNLLGLIYLPSWSSNIPLSSCVLVRIRFFFSIFPTYRSSRSPWYVEHWCWFCFWVLASTLIIEAVWSSETWGNTAHLHTASVSKSRISISDESPRKLQTSYFEHCPFSLRVGSAPVFRLLVVICTHLFIYFDVGG